MNDGYFINSIKGHEGIEISLFLSDGRKIEGTILSIHQDFLELELEDKTCYFPINQIRAFSKNAKDSKLLLSQKETYEERSFSKVLNDLRLQWITVNSLHQLTFSGVLSQVANEHIMLINNEKQYFILQSQIISVYKGTFKEQQEKKSEEVKEESESEVEQEINNGLENTLTEKNTSVINAESSNDSFTQELFQIKQVKFNSPFEQCTWNTVQESSSSSSSKAETSPIIENDIQDKDDPPLYPKEEAPEIIIENNLALIEKQYYSLMKFAENMYSLEKQYQALMKHAEKMYLQLKNKREN